MEKRAAASSGVATTGGENEMFVHVTTSFSKHLLFLTIVLLFSFLLAGYVCGNETMEIKKDDDKTTYTIGPSRDDKNGKSEEERDKERAWDMLKNMGTIIDRRGQSGQPDGR